MEDIVKNFAETLGIKPTVAKKGLSIKSRYYILKSDPVKAGGLLSMLPPSLTNCFLSTKKTKSRQIKKLFLQAKLLRKYLMNVFRVINKKEKPYMKKQ